MNLHNLCFILLITLQTILMCWTTEVAQNRSNTAMLRGGSGGPSERPRRHQGSQMRNANSKRGRNKCRSGSKKKKCRGRQRITTTSAPETTSTNMSVTTDHLYCPLCPMRENRKAARLQAIKADILRKLGLKAPPNVSVANLPNIPPLTDIQMNQWPNDMSAHELPVDYEDDDDYQAQPISIILFRKDPPEDRGLDNDTCYFQFESGMSTKVSRAVLGVYLRGVNGTSLDEFQTAMLVYQIKPSKNTRGTLDKPLVASSEISLRPDSAGHWVTVDLTEVVNQWIDDPSTNLGLEISAYDASGNSIVVNRPLTENETQQKPYLELALSQTESSRLRRHRDRNVCKENTIQDTCCRYPLEVNFETMQWDFIIAPKKFVANYCSGKCPYAYAATGDHSIIIEAAKPEHDLGLCCSPTELYPVDIVYVDETGKIMKGRLSGMIAEKCSCV